MFDNLLVLLSSQMKSSSRQQVLIIECFRQIPSPQGLIRSLIQLYLHPPADPNEATKSSSNLSSPRTVFAWNPITLLFPAAPSLSPPPNQKALLVLLGLIHLVGDPFLSSVESLTAEDLSLSELYHQLVQSSDNEATTLLTYSLLHQSHIPKAFLLSRSDIDLLVCF